MRKECSTVSFKNQVIYCGIDVHKKSWKVCIRHYGMQLDNFSMNPDPQKLVEYLKRNYPGAKYRSVYEAGFSGFEAHRTLCKLGVENIVIYNKQYKRYLEGGGMSWESCRKNGNDNPSYGINWWISRYVTGIRLTKIRHSSIKVYFADANHSGDPGVGTTDGSYVLNNAKCLSVRHSDRINFLWVDGHVSEAGSSYLYAEIIPGGAINDKYWKPEE